MLRDPQTVVALLLVAGAALLLGRRLWNWVGARGNTGCGSCGSCSKNVNAPSAPVLVSLTDLRAPPSSDHG